MMAQLRAYLRERMRPGMLLTVSLALVFAARGIPTGYGLKTLADVGLALALVMFLRLWDDLEDVPDDSLQHPERVLVQATDVTMFVRLAVGAGMACSLGLVMSRGAAALLPWALFCGGLFAWYRVGRMRVNATVRYHVLLLKYPVVAALVAVRAPVPAWSCIALGACAAYGAACLYEGWHDPRHEQHPRTVCMLGIEACLTAMVLGYYLKSIPPMGVLS